MINYQLAREELIETLQRKGIKDKRVLDTIREVKRHLFIPPNMRGRAYEDSPLPIGKAQTISQPYMVAWMTELLHLKGKEKVLEIGTGSGYQAAILAHLCAKVFTVERISELAKEARERFEKQGIDNIVQKVGDGTLGWREFEPYDCIIVTAGAPSIPNKLINQLIDGGRMVIPTGPRRIQDLKLVVKHKGEPLITSEGGCIFVPLLGSDGWKSQEK
ncbi:MAG: protein-L-isoaspartate(D-aspartate) O-methyltransferase [Candidatus Electryonea clarkiae]|nr:protein-L-isoaspartate(D-aspartate) O-methyltransferase [Candidatus Electryonea clarkiae]MDP8285587.1 protein-L-isoaspartate(D-aspartate) O-methyltransferase [Candidatus Electryonea clarkiae]